MNRCLHLFRFRHRITPQFSHSILLALLVICVGALLSLPHATLAQSTPRPFPADAKRGVMEVQSGHSIMINGSAERLSPGARIRGVNNLLVLSGQMVGQKVLVNYTRDAQGSIHQVWVINEHEARQERPGMEPTTNVLFESTPPKSNAYFK